VYCQNKQISANNNSVFHPFKTFDELIEKIKTTLHESENVLGFVSPTHHQMLMKAIIRRLHEEGLHPKTIYNTNAYDNPAALRKLEGIIDIYLPDYKYTDSDLAKQLSKAADYPQRALEAITEMYRQKGSSLLTDSENKIESGLIVRHLILPSQIENSKRVLDNLSDISFNLSVSLMSQYAPLEQMDIDFLNSRLSQEEYDEVCDYFYSIGLHKGCFQELSSQDTLIPDFEKGSWS
jgi:putative pyruvate formate lyase activating enzyme